MPKANHQIEPVLWSWMKSGLGMTLFLAMFLVLGSPHATGQDKPATGTVACPSMGLEAVGQVAHRDGRVFVEIDPAYGEALDGIEGFSHIWVIYWFHGNDTPEKRRTLKVHPRDNSANPLTGVFATRSPVRPNLLGLNACRLVGRNGNRLDVEGLDAWDGSPVLDIKTYLPVFDAFPHTTTPAWPPGKQSE